MADRVLAVVPLIALFAGVAALYVWQGSRLVTPWTYYDELYYTRLARSIAGHPSLNLGLTGAPAAWTKLYAVLIAPAWLLDSNSAAYDTVKVIGALVMSATVFPAFALARTVVSRPLAYFAAAGAVAVPAMTYSSQVMEEPLAYFYATLCFFLFAKALATRRGAWIAGAIAACAVAPLVRRELAAVVAVFILAAAAYALSSGEGRRRWSSLRPLVKGLTILGAVVALLILAALAAAASSEWSAAIHHPAAGLSRVSRASGVFVVGVGFVPAIAAVALVLGAPRLPASRTRRAFVCLLGAALVVFLAYTAVKTAFLASIAFSNPTTERNLIYLVPLAFVALAVWFEATGVRIVPLALSAIAVTGALLWIPLRFPPYPASHAPSFAVLAKAHQLGWTRGDIHAGLVAAAVIATLALFFLPRVRSSPGQVGRLAVPVVCAAILVWTLAAELQSNASAASYSKLLAATLPRPLDWVDRATGGQRTIYVGQKVVPKTDVLTLSFWNRSLVGLFRLDPSIGKEVFPVTLGRSGRVPVDSRARYVVAGYGIRPVGRPITHRGRWTLYSVPRPARLASAVVGVYGDGWMGGRSSYRVYAENRPGAVRVTLSRKLSCLRSAPAQVSVTATELGNSRFPLHRKTRRATLPYCGTKTFAFRERPPFRVDVRVRPTFVPAKLIPGSPDTRRLGAQAHFSFRPGQT